MLVLFAEEGTPLNDPVGFTMSAAIGVSFCWFIKELCYPTMRLTPPWVLDELRKDRFLATLVFGERRAEALGHWLSGRRRG